MTKERGDQEGKSKQATTQKSRRGFLRSAGAAGGAAALIGSVSAPFISRAQAQALQPRQVPLPGKPDTPSKANHWYVPASDKTVHWGYFSKSLKPIIEIDSGDYVTLECLTHQAGDDPDHMIKGDPGAESVYHWTKDQKNVN